MQTPKRRSSRVQMCKRSAALEWRVQMCKRSGQPGRRRPGARHLHQQGAWRSAGLRPQAARNSPAAVGGTTSRGPHRSTQQQLPLALRRRSSVAKHVVRERYPPQDEGWRVTLGRPAPRCGGSRAPRLELPTGVPRKRPQPGQERPVARPPPAPAAAALEGCGQRTKPSVTDRSSQFGQMDMLANQRHFPTLSHSADAALPRPLT
jgi:hypothetical protein